MSVESELSALLGSDRISTGIDELRHHAHDHTPRTLISLRGTEPKRLPLCVVRPQTTQEVSHVLEWASATLTPVVPFGAGSAVVDSINPSGAIVLDMSAMDRVVEIDDKSRLVTVEAGVRGPALHSALGERRLMLGHEPQSVDISTVGGWLATRASGQLSARYGGIEKLVAGMRFVFPNGGIAHAKATPRRAAGPDLLSLVIGSEGTLGVFTEVTLRVSPIPDGRSDVCIRFEHMTDGVAACRGLAQSDLKPTLVRLYDADDSAIFLRHFPEEPQGPLLLLSFDGYDAAGRADHAVRTCGGSRGNDALVGHWWQHRNDAVEEFRKLVAGEGILGPHAAVDTMEVSATWSTLRDVYHGMKEALSERADIAGCHLSHVYPDGACLYFTMASVCDDDREAAERLASWWEGGMRACLDAGGSISHHHGIGRLKAPWIAEELGAWHAALVALKRTWDPGGIMNPGVLGL